MLEYATLNTIMLDKLKGADMGKSNFVPSKEKRNLCVVVMMTPAEKEVFIKLAKKGERTISQQIRFLLRPFWEEEITSSNTRSRAAGDRCR